MRAKGPNHQPLNTNSLYVTSQMLFLLATTNCGGSSSSMNGDGSVLPPPGSITSGRGLELVSAHTRGQHHHACG